MTRNVVLWELAGKVPTERQDTMRNITTTELKFHSIDAADDARNLAIETGGHIGTHRDLNAVHASRIGYDAEQNCYTFRIVDNPEDSQFYTWTTDAVANYNVTMLHLYDEATSVGDTKGAERYLASITATGEEMTRRGDW